MRKKLIDQISSQLGDIDSLFLNQKFTVTMYTNEDEELCIVYHEIQLPFIFYQNILIYCKRGFMQFRKALNLLSYEKGKGKINHFYI